MPKKRTDDHYGQRNGNRCTATKTIHTRKTWHLADTRTILLKTPLQKPNNEDRKKKQLRTEKIKTGREKKTYLHMETWNMQTTPRATLNKILMTNYVRQWETMTYQQKTDH